MQLRKERPGRWASGLSWHVRSNPLVEGRLDTLAAFNIDSREILAQWAVRPAEGRDPQNAPAKDGRSRPSFAGALRL